MDGIIDSVDINLSKLQKIVRDSEPCAAVHVGSPQIAATGSGRLEGSGLIPSMP